MMSFKKSAVVVLSLLVVTAQVNAATSPAAIGAGVGDEVAAANAAAASTVDPVGDAVVGGGYLTGLMSTVSAGRGRLPAVVVAPAAVEAAGVRRPAALDAAVEAAAAAAAAAAAEEEEAAVAAPASIAAAAAAASSRRRLPAAAANNSNIAQRAWNGAVAAFCVAVAGVRNHKVTTGASVATVVAVGATYARLNVMFKAASPAVKAAGFKAFAKAELKKAFSRDAKADKYVTAGVVATLISAAATVGSVTLHETDVASKGLAHLPALPKWRSAPVA